jgi:hypothetical protein
MTEPSQGRLERAAAWVNGHPLAVVGAVLAFYAVIVAAQSALKLLWVDELITFYIARQPGLTGIWQALQAGADPNPPLLHVLVKASTALLGGNAMAIRLPAVLGVLLAIVALWWMLRRWVRPVFALTGVLAFMATRGFDYAYDARSYALMMGFAMASLACWMASRDLPGGRRAAALAGMALALAAGISSNYYCVLAFFPIALGEVVGRRFRMGTWIAMALASLPLVAYLPLIQHNIAEFGPHAWNRPRASMLVWSYLELVEGIFWPVLALASFAAWKRRGAWPIPPPEMAAVGVLLVYPFLGYAIALGGAGLISPRCVVPVCCGFGLAAGLLAARVFRGSARAGMALVALLVLWVGVRQTICAYLLWQQRRSFFAFERTIQDRRSRFNLILVADSSFALPFHFYAGRDVRRLIFFPIDFDAIHRFEPDDSGEQNLWAGRNGVFPLRIVPFTSLPLLQPEQKLMVIARPGGWLATQLHAQGIDLDEAPDDPAWAHTGGVFTPLAHTETRLLLEPPVKPSSR